MCLLRDAASDFLISRQRRRVTKERKLTSACSSQSFDAAPCFIWVKVGDEGVNEERREGSGSSQSGGGGVEREEIVFFSWAGHLTLPHYISLLMSFPTAMNMCRQICGGPPAGISSMGLAILVVARISSASYESLGLLNLTLQ